MAEPATDTQESTLDWWRRVVRATVERGGVYAREEHIEAIAQMATMQTERGEDTSVEHAIGKIVGTRCYCSRCQGGPPRALTKGGAR